jgi:hypothetical protein
MEITGLLVEMFLLGLISMGAFFAFLIACERI